MSADRLCGLVTVFTPASDLFSTTLWSQLLLYRGIDYNYFFFHAVYFIIVPRLLTFRNFTHHNTNIIAYHFPYISAPIVEGVGYRSTACIVI
jgi:hypothetical protein